MRQAGNIKQAACSWDGRFNVHPKQVSLCDLTLHKLADIK